LPPVSDTRENGEEGPGPVIVHDLAHVRAALAAAAELGTSAVLASAPDAAAYLGSGAFKAMIDLGRREYRQVPVTAILDCGDAPGLALGALRIGIQAIRLRAAPDVLARVADIAGQLGAVLYTDDRPALDLARERDPEVACRRWLAPL
jgi:hypothetical protein